MTEQSDIDAAVKLLREVLEGARSEDGALRAAWSGPRSNEAGFRMADGREVSMAVRVWVPGAAGAQR